MARGSCGAEVPLLPRALNVNIWGQGKIKERKKTEPVIGAWAGA